MITYVSFIVFVVGSIYLKKAKKFTHWNVIFVTGLSLWLVYLTHYTFADHGAFSILVQGTQKLLLSFLDVVQTFLLNKEWSNIIYDPSERMIYVEQLWLLLLFCLAPVLTFSTIVKYLTETFYLVRLKLSFKKTLNIFYKDSPMHQCVLQTIAHVSPGENNIVSNFSGEKEDIFNTVYSEYSILKLKERIKKHTKNYYFLDGDLDSLKESITLIESYGDTDSGDFLFVKDDHSLMANFLQANPRHDNQLKVRIVNNDKFALYQHFYEYADLIAEAFKKESILIVGNNYRAHELLKMLLWLQQSANTSLSISYLYEDDKDKARLLSAMPAVFDDESYEKSFTLNLLKGDYEDYSRVSELMRVHHIRTVFAVSDDTFSNLSLSKYLDKHVEVTIDIFVALDSEFVLKTLEPNKNYNVISFFSEDYIVNNLISSNSQLEKEALAYHTTYQNQFIEKTFITIHIIIILRWLEHLGIAI